MNGIIGNTVGTPMPRTNYNQTNPTAADYLGGREEILSHEQQTLTEAQKAQARQNIGAADATLIESSVTIIGVDKYGTKHSFTLYGKEDTPTEATVTLKVKDGEAAPLAVIHNGKTYRNTATFTANVGDKISIMVEMSGYSYRSFVVNGERLRLDSVPDAPFVYKHTIVSNDVVIEHGANYSAVSVSIEDAPVYENCTDKNGNVLKPLFVNNRYWEISNGNLKMPKGYENSFLLFNDELANKRIEATFVVRDTGLWADGNRRCGIVFALTEGNKDFSYDGGIVSYYWAFINDWNCVEVVKMGAYGNWQWLSTRAADLYYTYGIDVTKGVTLAAEWDYSGHIRIYANGILVQDVADSGSILSGGCYGLLVNNYGNFNPAYGPYDSPVTSFVAG